MSDVEGAVFFVSREGSISSSSSYVAQMTCAMIKIKFTIDFPVEDRSICAHRWWWRCLCLKERHRAGSNVWANWSFWLIRTSRCAISYWYHRIQSNRSNLRRYLDDGVVAHQLINWAKNHSWSGNTRTSHYMCVYVLNRVIDIEEYVCGYARVCVWAGEKTRERKWMIWQLWRNHIL